MPNTYTQLYIHVVFAVEGRQSLIAPRNNDELQKYITGITAGQKQKLIAINNLWRNSELNMTSAIYSNPLICRLPAEAAPTALKIYGTKHLQRCRAYGASPPQAVLHCSAPEFGLRLDQVGIPARHHPKSAISNDKDQPAGQLPAIAPRRVTIHVDPSNYQ